MATKVELRRRVSGTFSNVLHVATDVSLVEGLLVNDKIDPAILPDSAFLRASSLGTITVNSGGATIPAPSVDLENVKSGDYFTIVGDGGDLSSGSDGDDTFTLEGSPVTVAENDKIVVRTVTGDDISGYTIVFDWMANPAADVPLASYVEDPESYTSGLMTGQDKLKLDEIESGAEVNVIDRIKIDDDVVAIVDETVGDITYHTITIPLATASTGTAKTGVITPADKDKLDVLVTDDLSGYDFLANDGTYKEVVMGVKLSDSATAEALTDGILTIPLATTTIDGLMSSEDKAKVDVLVTDGAADEFLAKDGTYKIVEGGTGSDIVIQGEDALVPVEGTVTIPLATTTVSGAMAFGDKEKVDALVIDDLSGYDFLANDGTYKEVVMGVKLSDSGTAETLTDGILTIPYATATQDGIVELATGTEYTTGASAATTQVATPAGVMDMIDYFAGLNYYSSLGNANSATHADGAIAFVLVSDE
jgi:hypothetical protein